MRLLLLLLLPIISFAQLPTTGSLSIKSAAGAGRSISQQVDGNETGNKSLTTLSTTAGFTAPHSMLEFYGYPTSTAPDPVTNCSASINWGTGMPITWTLPADLTGVDWIRVKIKENGSYRTVGTIEVYYYNNTQTSHTWPHADLTEGSSYSYDISTGNDIDGPSVTCVTSALIYQVAPSAPASCSATVQSGVGIDVAWTFGSGGGTPTGTDINVSVNGGSFVDLTQVAYAGTTYAHTTVSTGNTYRYSITVYNDAGTSSACLTATKTFCSGAPNAVTSASASVVADDVTVSWDPDALGQTATQFRIERDAQSNPGFVFVANVSAGGSNSYTDNNLLSDQYLYRVRAENDCGNSSYVNTNSVIVP